MKSITFIDTEIEPNSGRILDIGCVKWDGSSFHSSLIAEFKNFLQGTRYICGHNIFKHDLKYIKKYLVEAGLSNLYFIDTLYLSPLMFPAKPYHSLLKDDKLQTDDINNPLNDSIKAKDLFFDEVTAFHQMDNILKRIYSYLLKDRKEFGSFFHFLEYRNYDAHIENLIHEKYKSQICENANLSEIIANYPI